MKAKLFKPGERVQLKSEGPIMTVQKYVHEYDPIVGWHENNNAVLCTWVDAKKGCQKLVTHQKNLAKYSLTSRPI